MQKVRNVLIGVIAAIAGGLTAYQAFDQEMDIAGLTCPELRQEYLANRDQLETEFTHLLNLGLLDKCPNFSQLVECWSESDGSVCLHGLHYGPGMGGVRDGACATFVLPQDIPMPCAVAAGDDATKLRGMNDEAKEQLRDHLLQEFKNKASVIANEP